MRICGTDPFTVTNTYYNRMRTNLSLAQPTGSWTNQFGYDAAKRLTNVTSPAGTFSYSFSQPSTLIQKLLLPNTSYITNTYDSMARLTGTYLKTSGNVLTNKHEYTYNVGNQRTQQTFMDAATYGYTYDKIGQLTNADSSLAAQDRKYVYDEAWNLNYRTNNTTLNTFLVDVKNQLTNATPMGGQTYDDNGNLTYADGSFQGYAYDDENQLQNWYHYDGGYNGNGEPTDSKDKRTEFVYDGKGRLRKRVEYNVTGSAWAVSTETRYIYDGMRVIQERNSGNTPTVAYTRGTDLSGSLEGAGGIGGLLGRANGSSGNLTNHNVYFADGNGNVTYMLNSSQSKVAEYRFDPFGNLISSGGTLAAANVYRFSSKEIHVNSGLYYYGERFYPPNLQRWLNRDPLSELGHEALRQRSSGEIGTSANEYAFLHNSPSSRIDAFGLSDDNDAKPFIDLLKFLKKVYDNMPNNPKKCLSPCSSVISGRAICDCIWGHLQTMKQSPAQADNEMDAIAKCICLAGDAECWKNWKKTVKDIFYPVPKEKK
ncbi:MAG: RHS repeat-associated core domain-containing protein [Verrucomicrobia bacterium]|nr:RHS repeat-associated core domain-containing protein [Verrucomicrobiota bacterium]